MEFINDAPQLTMWLSALFEDYSKLVNSFVQSELWTYDGFEGMAKNQKLNYIHLCSVKKSKSGKEEHHRVMSNLIMDAAKRYYLHFPWIPLRPDEKKRPPQDGPSTSAGASAPSSSENSGLKVDMNKITEARLKALVAGFYLVYYIYRSFPNLPSPQYEQAAIKVGKEDIAKMTMFLGELVPTLKDLIGETGKLACSTVISLNFDLILRRAYKPTVGGGSFGIAVHQQVFHNMVEAKTMEFLIQDQDITTEVTEVEEKIHKVLERTTDCDIELKNLKSGCLKKSLAVKYWNTRRNNHTDDVGVGERNPDQMRLVLAESGNRTGEHVERDGPEVTLSPSDETLIKTYTDLRHLGKNRPMHMKNMAFGHGPGAVEQKLVTRAKRQKLTFVIPRKNARQHSQRKDKASGKVWGFICDVPKFHQSTSTALVPYQSRLPVRGGFRSPRFQQPLALTFGEDVELDTTQPSVTAGRGGTSTRSRGRPRAGNSRGRAQGRRGRGRIFSGALASRVEDHEGERDEQLDVPTRGRGRRGVTRSNGGGLGRGLRGRGAGRRGRGRGRGRISTQRSSTDQQQGVQVSTSTVGRGRRGRGRPKKTDTEPPLRRQRANASASSATTSLKMSSDLQPQPSVSGVQRSRGRPKKNVEPEFCLRGSTPGPGKNLTQNSSEVDTVDTQSTVEPSASAIQGGPLRKQKKTGLEPKPLRGRGRGTQNR